MPLPKPPSKPATLLKQIPAIADSAAPAAPDEARAAAAVAPPLPSTRLALVESRARSGRKARPAGPARLFVLDTNVLMHDPTSLFRFEEHDVFLPMMTLEELDGHKKGMSEVARNARQVSRSLDALIAVCDTCGYLPRLVRRSAQALRDAVGRYLFVSSISVYADSSASGQDEQAPRAPSPGPNCEHIAGHYGALKAACEDEVQASFGERAIVVRPGLIVGPFDPSGRFTYWAQRLARGGTGLAPPSPDCPVQFIDARDLAAWMLDLLEQRRAGAFNASGPATPLTFGAFLHECRRALGARAEFVWPDEAFLGHR